jgi:hypothetical protein
MGNKQASLSNMFVKSKLKYVLNIAGNYTPCGNMRRRSLLRHCATNRKVLASIPDGVTGIFHSHNPSGRNMALRSTQPLTEMINIFPGGLRWLVRRTDNLTTFMRRLSGTMGASNSWNPLGLNKTVQGLFYLYVPCGGIF